MTQNTKIYAIRSKLTGDFVGYNSKCAWAKAGNAKNAFALHHRPSMKWDEQDEFELVELTEYVAKYEGLCK